MNERNMQDYLTKLVKVVPTKINGSSGSPPIDHHLLDRVFPDFAEKVENRTVNIMLGAPKITRDEARDRALTELIASYARRLETISVLSTSYITPAVTAQAAPDIPGSGFHVIIGSAGSGKTTTLRDWYDKGDFVAKYWVSQFEPEAESIQSYGRLLAILHNPKIKPGSVVCVDSFKRMLYEGAASKADGGGGALKGGLDASFLFKATALTAFARTNGIAIIGTVNPGFFADEQRDGLFKAITGAVTSVYDMDLGISHNRYERSPAAVSLSASFNSLFNSMKP